MFNWKVTSPIEGTYRVNDKPWDTVVWFYEVGQRWECEDCLQNNCPHISAAKKFKREGEVPMKQITAPNQERSFFQRLRYVDDALRTSDFSTRT